MFNYVFEITVNLLQSIYFVGFFLLFLGGKFSTRKNIILLSIFIALNFAVLTYFTYNQPNIVMLDMFIGIILYEIYCITCLKGELAIKLILPFIVSLINTIISYGFVYSSSIISGVTFEELITKSSLFRYLFVCLANLATMVVLFIMWRTKAKTYSLKKVSNVIAFVVIPLLAMMILYITMYIMILTNFQSNIIIFLSIICISMIVIAGIVWFMIARINKDNEIKTKLLLSEQKANLYKQNIISSNSQIETIKLLKHDMKNNILCIDALIEEENYDEAHNICHSLTNKYTSIGTIVNTENYLLNAVLNVEIEKAKSYEIPIKLSITNDLKMFKNSSDIISLIGNILDNAISYLSKNKVKNNEINLSTGYEGSYSIIKCRNNILDSVLFNNPSLKTDKEDKDNHGKGITIINSIAHKYNGDVIIKERNKEFIITVILDNRSLPENL
ncbi:GHKL domain-containing protein [Ruminococcus bovis]|uniref:GHKL domain-containing protein n=2 Tax=Ruminococcus bovis TaxID=2564099 RepID=A0A4P8Y044_9FIRM|nr:GHKL domain-containing protein [Ruminococcus bovis]